MAKSRKTKKSNDLKRSTLKSFSEPKIGVENRLRISMFRNKKESGTTMPAVLFYALKLKLMISEKYEEEPVGMNKDLKSILRNLLSDIQTMAGDKKGVLVGKTFQEIVFRHIVWSEPLLIRDTSQLVPNDVKNRAHTVSGNYSPTCSIPSYLCRWLLEKDGLNTDCNFVQINSYVKRISRNVDVYLSKVEGHDWKSEASFSSRVQNHLFLEAFSTVFNDEQLSKSFIAL